MNSDDQPPPRTIHAPGCPLDSIYWLRHAIAAAGRLVNDPDGADTRLPVDAVSARALIDQLALFAEIGDWDSITLREVADSAAATVGDGDAFGYACTCGAYPGNRPSPLRW